MSPSSRHLDAHAPLDGDDGVVHQAVALLVSRWRLTGPAAVRALLEVAADLDMRTTDLCALVVLSSDLRVTAAP